MDIKTNYHIIIIFMILQRYRTQSCKWISMWEANNTPNVGPGSLRALPVVADGSESGHCFGPGGLRAPHMVADEAKQAIVFTYFFSSFSSTTSAFHPLRGISRA